jgi:hypothetical protein
MTRIHTSLPFGKSNHHWQVLPTSEYHQEKEEKRSDSLGKANLLENKDLLDFSLKKISLARFLQIYFHTKTGGMTT